MAQILNTGPGTGTRKTIVSRLPFWKPDEEEWIFLPVDRAHNQQITEEDREGNSLGAINLYESKGWFSLRQMQRDTKAMAKLPTNWRDVGNHNAAPVFAEAAGAKV